MKFLILANFNQRVKTQPLAKFIKILYIGFRATFNFQNFKVALNSMYMILLKVASNHAY